MAKDMICKAKCPLHMTWRSLAMVSILAVAIVSVHGAEQTVAASEIVELILAKEPVYYDNITVLGDLDLSSLPDAQVPVSFAMTNSRLDNASFEGVTFEQDAVFCGTTFGRVGFEKSSFLGYADFADTSFANTSFSACSFSRPTVFDRSLFWDRVSFEDAIFSEDASFNRARFQKEANFNYSDFNSYSYFASAEFLGDAFFSDVDFLAASDFSAASFAGQANFFSSRMSALTFSDAHFTGPAQFGLASFSGLSSFGGSVFADEAGFGLARFSGAAYFSGAKFRGLALFGLAKFEDIVSFDHADFSGDLNFKSASIATLLFEKATLGKASRIILNDSDILRFKAHWNVIDDHVVWDPGAYLALVENYRRLGWSNDEDDCYYQYRWFDQINAVWGWSKIVDILAWLSCGYGVKPGYAALWSLLVILIFALIYWNEDGIRRAAKPLHEPAEKYAIPGQVTMRNALFFSTMIFISRGPNEFLPIGRNRYFVIIEGIIGWLLLALFLVTLGRVMIR
jgi:uncharacterized protein YjbI with pentapeptide repeats